jgi:hypothetical protein
MKIVRSFVNRSAILSTLALRLKSLNMIQIKLEVIPKKSPRIAYIETLKTNFDQMIYNCGEILSLWFGILAMNTENFFKFLFRIFIFSKNFLKSSSQILFAN